MKGDRWSDGSNFCRWLIHTNDGMHKFKIDKWFKKHYQRVLRRIFKKELRIINEKNID